MLQSDVPDNLPLPRPGTHALFTSLFTHIRSTGPSTLPLDAVVFQSILLCLIAGDKHLILRTPEEDVGLVVKLATLTLTSLFAYPTHKLKIRRSSSPSESGISHPTSFLRSLFLPSASSANPTFQYDSPNNSHKSKQKQKRNKRARSRSRSRSAKLGLIPKPYARSVSYPSDLAFATHAHLTTSLSASPDQSRDHHWDGLASAANSASPGPSSPFASASNRLTWASTSSSSGPPSAKHPQAKFPPYPPVSHAHTEPTPARQTQDATSLQLPRALVLTGLENASLPSQRALVRVLAERRVVLEGGDEIVGGRGRVRELWRGEEDEDMGSYGAGGEGYGGQEWNDDLEDQYDDGVWNLPDGFIMIYVCPWDARERPAIHKSLLDKFAMSTTVTLHHTTRQAIRAMSFMSHPLSPSHQSQSQSHSHLHGSSPSRSLPLSLPQVQNQFPNHLPPSLSHSFPPPHHHHHYHHQHGQLTPVPSEPLFPPALLLALRTSYQRTHFDPHLYLYTSDLFSAARHHPQLDGTLLTAQSMKDAEHLARAGRVLGRDRTGMELVRYTNAEVLGQRDIVDEDEDRESDGEEGYESLADMGNGNVKIDLLPPASDSASYQHSVQQQYDTEDEQGDVPPLDVSEADVARIVPRVMSHRLRVRDGPEDEILASAFFKAVKGERAKEVERSDSRSTVKDILVKILSEV